MLNNNALQQLAQLKTHIKESKNVAQGRVRTTTKRFSFVVLEDGKEIFLDPDQTQRVLPNDLVEIEIIDKGKDQFEGKLEKLIESDFKEFVGRYVNRGTNFFIEVDAFQFNRWLFVAPSDRKGLNENDFVHATLTRHPFTDGKAQIKILTRIGASQDLGIENTYTQYKFNLPNQWTAQATAQANSINWMPLDFESHEKDLTHLVFVTIDSENTRDMDDAIYIERQAQYWDLWVAIANPTKHILLDTPLELAARERATTHYLLGQSVTMLPSELSNDTYSLVAEKKRPALVCRLKITFNGDIENYEFFEAQIRSHHKLSYQAVSDHLENVKDINLAGFNLSEQEKNMLSELQRFATARTDYRAANALVMEDKPDFAIILNELKKIDRIERRDRNCAQRIVEESMLLTNLCAGDLFSKHPLQGIFSTHIGIKPERIQEAFNLIQEDRPDLIEAGLKAEHLGNLETYQSLIKSLRNSATAHPENKPLLSLLQRMMQPGSLSFEAKSHFGLAFKYYAMITSPIRRYNDLYNHLAIKRILRNEEALSLTHETLVGSLQEQINRGRQASRFLETWLVCDFMKSQIDTLHTATISLVNGNGIGVQLDDSGVEAYAMLAPRNSDIKSHFDSRRLSLTVEDKTYRLDEKVQVLIKEVDVDKRKISVEVVDEKTAERLSVWM